LLIRTARMSKAIDTLTTAFSLPTKPKVEDVFSSAFLPAADIRKLP